MCRGRIVRTVGDNLAEQVNGSIVGLDDIDLRDVADQAWSQERWTGHVMTVPLPGSIRLP